MDHSPKRRIGRERMNSNLRLDLNNIDSERRKRRKFEPGSVGLNDFKVIGEVGSGATGVVYKVKHLDSDEIFAMKKI